ncbi:MAG: hypothetical protein AB1916_07065 [Thermodesulfobacteriota bacterium]
MAHLAVAEMLRQALGRNRLERLSDLPAGPVRGGGRDAAPDSGGGGSPLLPAP